MYRSLHRSMYLSIHPSIYLSICLSIYLSIYVSIYLSIPASLHPCIPASMHPCIHASMHPCIHASMHPCLHPFMYVFSLASLISNLTLLNRSVYLCCEVKHAKLAPMAPRTWMTTMSPMTWLAPSNSGHFIPHSENAVCNYLSHGPSIPCFETNPTTVDWYCAVTTDKRVVGG